MFISIEELENKLIKQISEETGFIKEDIKLISSSKQENDEKLNIHIFEYQNKNYRLENGILTDLN